MSAPLPPFSIEVRSRPYPAAQRAIMRGLHKYNDEKVGDWPFRRIVVTVRTKRGAVKGGLFGKIYWGWLFVEYFWLDGKLRGRDWGTKCLASAEAEATRRGCWGVWLDTGSFQAPGFYRKQGYRQFGKLDVHPPGYSRLWFFKRLKPPRPTQPKIVKASAGSPRRQRRPAAKTRRA